MSNQRIGVRINKQDRRLLEKVCKARGEDISDFVRRSIKKELASLSFYSAEDKKALGIEPVFEKKKDKETEKCKEKDNSL